MRRGKSGRPVLAGFAARVGFSGLGHEKLRELGLRGRFRLLPAFRLGLRLRGRATAGTGTLAWGLGTPKKLLLEQGQGKR